jgi:hypothetical protein
MAPTPAPTPTAAGDGAEPEGAEDATAAGLPARGGPERPMTLATGVRGLGAPRARVAAGAGAVSRGLRARRADAPDSPAQRRRSARYALAHESCRRLPTIGAVLSRATLAHRSGGDAPRTGLRVDIVAPPTPKRHPTDRLGGHVHAPAADLRPLATQSCSPRIGTCKERAASARAQGAPLHSTSRLGRTAECCPQSAARVPVLCVRERCALVSARRRFLRARGGGSHGAVAPQPFPEAAASHPVGAGGAVLDGSDCDVRSHHARHARRAVRGWVLARGCTVGPRPRAAPAPPSAPAPPGARPRTSQTDGGRIWPTLHVACLAPPRSEIFRQADGPKVRPARAHGRPSRLPPTEAIRPACSAPRRSARRTRSTRWT